MRTTIEWHQIDANVFESDLPDEEVIAVNSNNEMLIGYLYKAYSKLWCEDDGHILENVTHFSFKPNTPYNP